MTLTIKEHKSSSYAPRTYYNASQGCTIAIAVDFSTAGEKLTHKAAGERIVQIPFTMDYVEAARKLYSLLKKYDCHVVNVAGNGIYTLSKYAVDQHSANVYVYSILSLVHKHWTIEKVVSGGQTGIDTAGLVAACVLDIDCEGTWPKGYKMRFEDKQDVEKGHDWIEKWIASYVNQLKEVE